MESSIITTLFLPFALGVIMLGLGLSLRVDDFKRVVRYPKAMLVGLGCQMLLLPLACVAIATAFSLPPELAVGLVLLAASPGGATANLFSHLARGDVALNVSLTAVNSLLSLFTMPFLVNLAMAHFVGREQLLPLQFDKVIQVFAIVLVPVVIGMLIRGKASATAARLEKPVRILSAIFLILVILAAMTQERGNLGGYIEQVGLAALTFNLVSMMVGYFVPLLARLPKRQAVAIGMEIGVHNGTLAIAIASSPMLLNNTAMAIPAAVYSVIMFFTAAGFGWIVTRPGGGSLA